METAFAPDSGEPRYLLLLRPIPLMLTSDWLRSLGAGQHQMYQSDNCTGRELERKVKTNPQRK